jgi:hypothetical protein
VRKQTSIIILLLIIWHCSALSQSTSKDTAGVRNILKSDQIKTNSSREIAFFGISPGISLLSQSYYKPNWGFRFNLEAGYKLSRVIGISILYTRSVNRYFEENSIPSPLPGNPFFKRYEYEKETWKYAGILFGPSFCFSVSKNLSCRISPMAGYSELTGSYNYPQESRFAADLNTSLIFHSSHRIAFSMSGDLFSTDSFGFLSGSIEIGLVLKVIK